MIVYCQEPGKGPIREDRWNGLERVIIPIETEGWRGTSLFDLKSIRHASRHRDICLTFGYNTAVFNTLQRVKRIPLVINMDGIEWSRARWGWPRQAILYVNERIACLVGHQLIADHPEIQTYLETRAPARKISTITYGAHAVTERAHDRRSPTSGSSPAPYLTMICRPIPENSVLELVEGFSAAARGVRLAVLGDFRPERGPVPRGRDRGARATRSTSSGPSTTRRRCPALRFHCRRVPPRPHGGGHEPVAGRGDGGREPGHRPRQPVQPLDRRSARGARTSPPRPTSPGSSTSCSPTRPSSARMGTASRARYEEEFTWDHVAGQYEQLLLDVLDRDEKTQEADLITAAVVGLGKMGLSHLSMMRATPGVEVVGVCDSSGYLLGGPARYTGLATYSSYEKMLDEATLDAVIIATPSNLHAPMVRAAIERGRPRLLREALLPRSRGGGRARPSGHARPGSSPRSATTTASWGRSARSSRCSTQDAIGDVVHVLGEAYGPVVLKPQGTHVAEQPLDGRRRPLRLRRPPAQPHQLVPGRAHRRRRHGAAEHLLRAPPTTRCSPPSSSAAGPPPSCASTGRTSPCAR